MIARLQLERHRTSTVDLPFTPPYPAPLSPPGITRDELVRLVVNEIERELQKDGQDSPGDTVH